MIVQSEIDRINGNVASTYTALSEMGATMPAQQNSDNLPGTVRTVPQGGSKTVQTDWNQTDETAPDFLKNKPFGDSKTVIFPLEEVRFSYDAANGGAMAAIPCNVTVNVGDTLTVDWGGETYETTVTQAEGMMLFGNLSFIGIGADSGEPFVGMVYEGMSQIIDPFAQGDITRNIDISIARKIRIDKDYLPFTLQKFYIDNTSGGYLYWDSACTKKVSSNELIIYADSGAFIISYYDFLFLYPSVTARAATHAEVRCWNGEKMLYCYTAEYVSETTT
jgi:hypothetical protein